MDEPLMCWLFLFFAMAWGICTRKPETQERLKATFKSMTPFVQWYNVTFVLLSMLFLRTIYDIFRFDIVMYRMLSWDAYKDNLDPSKTHIPLSSAELNTHNGPLVMPTFIRVLSLSSPFAGLAAFAISAKAVVDKFLRGGDEEEDEEEELSHQFLKMVVMGMPLLYIVMALRATIRQWAVMTGSCWLPYKDAQMNYEDRLQTWKSLKAAEISTYTQDLDVASGFQFFAVFCFGQVCTKALKNTLLTEALRNNDQNAGFPNRQARELSADGNKLLQLGIQGLHAFVILGVLKTVFNMIIAVCSADWRLEATVEPFQQAFQHVLDPVFGFATALSVINMMVLSKMTSVAQVLPGVNFKFNATRALLLIGQVQLTVLRAATTDKETHTSTLLDALHKLPFGPFQRLDWWFNTNHARLLHSSLLCIECLAVVIINNKAWNEAGPAQAREAVERSDPRRAPLLDC